MDRQTNLNLKRITGIGAMMLLAGTIGFVPSASAAVNDDNADNNAAEESADNSSSNLPDTLTLDCVIRDFRPYNWEGGHPDFEYFGGTTTVGLVDEYLSEDGKPVSSGNLRGKKIKKEYRDSQGRNINPSMYDPEQGDIKGKLVNGPTSNGFTSAERFDQWYRDVPGVNLSSTIQLTLNKVEGTDRYVFDSDIDTEHGTYGFFPINGELYGNFKSGRNYHFTTEINTEFTFHRNTGQIFKFTGDDDVWVFIDGRLVVDLGGLHPKREQFLDLDRLDWLQDGRTYSFDIFHAERRYSGSNFRVETTLQLRAVELPITSAIYD
ncbi:MAG: fibro-slime domain-containing protein [Phycisphaerales bacterium]